MSSGYKLVYLNFRGRAELIRYIFAQAGQKYEDYRIAPEKWSEFRSTTPLGLVPILELGDGVVFSGNANIAAYLAEKFGKDAKRLCFIVTMHSHMRRGDICVTPAKSLRKLMKAI